MAVLAPENWETAIVVMGLTVTPEQRPGSPAPPPLFKRNPCHPPVHWGMAMDFVPLAAGPGPSLSQGTGGLAAPGKLLEELGVKRQL